MINLVAGGAGFIGHHLCKRLLAQGHKIVCIDNLSTGTAANLELLKDDNFKSIYHDITEPLYMIGHVDRIYNLACPASPVDYQFDPIKTMMTNVVGTKNLLDLAVQNNASFLQASTSEVYGDPHVDIQRESYFGNVNTCGPRACYDEGKRAAETLVYEYGKHGVKVHIARIFNTYGPNMREDDGRVIPNFIMQSLNDFPVTIYGNGKQTRSLCYVDDTVTALIRLMDNEYKFPVNVGKNSEISIAELADLIISLTMSKSKLTFEYLPIDDPRKRCPDVSLAKSLLGFEASIELIEGLGKTINYFVDRIKR